MEPHLDLYRALFDLIDQIPEDMVSTPLELANALGDRRAFRAVSEALQQGKLGDVEGRVVRRPAPNVEVFRGFSSERPLMQLAELQRKMSRSINDEDHLSGRELTAGVDVAYGGDEAFAACVVLDSRLQVVEVATAAVSVRFPYIPGYLSFREAPAVEAAARRVSGFDALLVNGQGVAHPRGCGLATHVGLDLRVPTIGVTKRRLVGSIGEAIGDWAPIIYRSRVVGAMLTVEGHAPVYVSIGHKVSLRTGVEIVRGMTAGGRLPEPLRIAHRAAEAFRRRSVSGSGP